MRKPTQVVLPGMMIAVLLLLAAQGADAATRTLTRSVPVGDLAGVSLEAGVGSIEIFAADSEQADTIEIDVELKPRRGGIFSSLRKAQRQVDEAELLVDRSRSRLRLKIDTDSDDHRFEERWTLHLPATLEMRVELGVGDLEVRDVSGGLSLEVGVGDVLVRTRGGDLELALGVGDAAIRAPAAAYGEVQCSSGVGDTRLRVEGRLVDSDGLVSHSASWRGDGPSTLDVEVGVGDSTITLE